MPLSFLAGLRLSHRWCPRFAECGLSVLHGFHHNGVRFNFVYFTAKDLPPLLYDVTNDPGESVDLAQNAEYAEVVLLATTELLSHRMAHAECACHHLQSNLAPFESLPSSGVVAVRGAGTS